MSNTARRTIATAAIVAAGASLPVDADAAAYLKLGDIKGESQHKVYKDHIEVLTWSWGVAKPVDVGSKKTGRSTAPCKMATLEMNKLMGVSSVPIVRAVAVGDLLPDATLILTNETAEGPMEYYKFDMRDVFVSDYAVSGSDDSVPTETFTLNFLEVDIEYTITKNTGETTQGPRFMIPSETCQQ
ncbi:Hcp family type VI secretion system effector [Marinihelvus fidelis]|nr:type VI secretion system tube protein Hcp [Marinihelvus fidelis]